MGRRVLVTAASQQGTTADIAADIAEVLVRRELDAEYVRMADVDDLSQFDSVVVGSAVYLGQWLSEAHEFLVTYRDQLLTKEVWLFSSGPLGNGEAVSEVDSHALMALVHGREHRVFAGALTRNDLPISERLLVTNLGLADGDYRDWNAIRAWADGVGREIAEARGVKTALF